MYVKCITFFYSKVVHCSELHPLQVKDYFLLFYKCFFNRDL